MKETILKLIQSSNIEDVMIGFELARADKMIDAAFLGGLPVKLRIYIVYKNFVYRTFPTGPHKNQLNQSIMDPEDLDFLEYIKIDI